MSSHISEQQNSEMLCGCSSMTVQQFYDFIAANPVGFDEVLRKTGAGQSCTACLLDLEYHYVGAFEAASRGANVDKTVERKTAKTVSLKQRIYNAIDAISPLTPFKLRQVAPVLYGAGVSQWLCVCNHSMMYEGKLSAPTFRLDLTLRDSEGKVVEQRRERVAAEESVRLNLSDALEKAESSDNGGLKLGWMDLVRSGETPGYRGTTRPQIEIVSNAGVCAVHTQAASERAKGGLTLRVRPGEDRLFLTVLNAESKPLAFHTSVSAASLAAPIEVPVEVPASGARLVEVPMPPATKTDRLGLLTDVTWSADRMHKVYIVCASQNLDRFSVDHA